MAEKFSFSSIWIAEDYFLRDSVTLLSCAAYATEEIRLGSGVINPFTRHPALIAQTGATLNELSRGRFALGLGSGSPEMLAAMGTQIDHPLRSMRECVEIIRLLARGEPVDFHGSDFRIKQAKLGSIPYYSEDGGDFAKGIRHTKIYLAAVGPKMLELCARIADGVLLTAGISCDTVGKSISILKKARSEYTNSFDLAGYVVACLGEPSIAAKKFVADQAIVWPSTFVDAGIKADEIQDFQSLYRRKGLEAAIPQLTDEMIRTIVAFGTVSEIEEKILDCERAGIETPVLIPMGTPAKGLISRIGG